MMRLRRLAALAVALAVLGACPGLDAYRACALTIETSVKLSNEGAPVSAHIEEAAFAAPSLPMPDAAAASALETTPAAEAGDAPSAFEGVSRELPEFERMPLSYQKDSAETDFLSRVGAARLASAPDAPIKEEQPARAAAGSLLAPHSARGTQGKADLAVSAAGIFSVATFFHGAALLPAYFGIVLPSLIVHEMSHAAAAAWLGDKTAKDAGRLSLNPRDWGTHLSPFWTIAVPAVSLLLTGVASGRAVPVQVHPENFTNRENVTGGAALVAFAGPAANLLIAGAATLVKGAFIAAHLSMIASAFGAVALVNATLGFLNLIPLAPLDGHHVLRWALKDVLRRPHAAAKLDDHLTAQKLAVYGGMALAASHLGAWPLLVAFVIGGLQVGRANLAELLDRHRGVLNLALGALSWDIGAAGDADFKNSYATLARPGELRITPIGHFSLRRLTGDGFDVEVTPGVVYNVKVKIKIWNPVRGSIVHFTPKPGVVGPQHEITSGDLMDRVKAKAFVFSAQGKEYWVLYGTDVDPATNQPAASRSFLFLYPNGLSSDAWSLPESALKTGQALAMDLGKTRVMLTKTEVGELLVSLP